ncbi:MAG: ATP-binding cassette domain-containing protein [Bacteroidales bacterium]|nr:ATP-binding cassette domain-containing protein [Bacteroidales bacterium]
MNDIVLSGMLNLFALVAATEKLERAKTESTIRALLQRHFGVRDVGPYLSLYADLLMFYSEMPELDKSVIIEGISAKLTGKISKEEQTLILLRLVEFCKDVFKGSDRTGGTQDENLRAILGTVAEKFSVDDNTLADLYAFIMNQGESKNVLEIPYCDSTVRTLLLPRLNRLVFVWQGCKEVMMNDIPIQRGFFMVWQQSSVLKSRHDKPLYFSTVMSHFQRRECSSDVNREITLAGRDINFRFDKFSDNGMHNFSFNLYGGELVAIMGGSGTGKSTLLSLLNGTNHPQEGTITINGHDINETEAKALIGFVPQDDLLVEELTVFENLWFTARLCFEGMSDTEINNRVMTILNELGLEAAKNLKVGSPMNKYISGGQRKRLNIALELIRQPAVLFLDEPTSGLSSSDTEKVVNLLKEQTYKGCLVVANIHQPSSDVYKLFDRLWLLDKGGYPIYDGNPIEAVTYFKNAANYVDAEISMCPTCGNVNPEIVLNIIDEKKLNGSGEISNERRVSPQEWHQRYLDNRQSMGTVVCSDIPHTDQRKPSAFKQMGIFMMRNLKTKVTNLQYLLITLLEAPLLAMICAMLTHYAPIDSEYSIMDNKNLVSYFFMAVIVAIFIGMSGSAEEIIKDRAVLKREKFLSLSYQSYIWSKILFMAGVTLIQTLLFIIVGNFVMGIHDLFWIWWLILFVAAFLSNLVGLLLSQSLNSVVAIYISIPLLLIPQILLCGLVVKFADLTPQSTTANVPVIGDFIPSRWAFEALAVTAFSENDYESNFFEAEQTKYQHQYYLHAILYELQSQLETMHDEQVNGGVVNPEHLTVIHNELPRLSAYCRLTPYEGNDSYESLDAYFSNAKKVLEDMNNKATLTLDKQYAAMQRSLGKEDMLKLKRNHYNLQLENLAMNADANHTHHVVNGHIVPQMGFIFLPSKTNDGRAPFYCATKRVGSLEIPTLWFNTLVELLMCLVVALCLFFDIPGRFIRQERN